jgi:hypothetical protein
VTDTNGDVVLVQDEGAEVSSVEIRRLWEMRHDEELVTARTELPQRASNPHLLDRLASWGEQLRQAPAENAQHGIQMIRRDAVEELAGQAQLLAGPRGRSISICKLPESQAGS